MNIGFNGHWFEEARPAYLAGGVEISNAHRLPRGFSCISADVPQRSSSRRFDRTLDEPGHRFARYADDLRFRPHLSVRKQVEQQGVERPVWLIHEGIEVRAHTGKHASR